MYAPTYSTESLHSAVVELIAMKGKSDTQLSKIGRPMSTTLLQKEALHMLMRQLNGSTETLALS